MVDGRIPSYPSIMNASRPFQNHVKKTVIIIDTLNLIRFTTIWEVKYREAATGGILQKKVFLKISQNSQENTCARVSFLIKLQAASVFQSINIKTYNSSRNREILLHIIWTSIKILCIHFIWVFVNRINSKISRWNSIFFKRVV